MKGRHHSTKTKEKLKQHFAGKSPYVPTDEIKNKIRNTLKGREPKNKGTKLSDEEKLEISRKTQEAMDAIPKERRREMGQKVSKALSGKSKSETHREKLRIAALNRAPRKWSEARRKKYEQRKTRKQQTKEEENEKLTEEENRIQTEEIRSSSSENSRES
jgi:hypothetical protein